MASNPEFLREGSAIEDFRRPDRVVVGCDTEKAREVMREIYRPLFLNETPILFTTRESSELIKYAANAFLATKVTFANEMADICEKVGADIQDVARGIGLDGRIGSKIPARRARFRRLMLSQGYAGAAEDGRGRRRRRRSSMRWSGSMTGARSTWPRRSSAPRRRAGQNHRGAGAHLQAEHRRHARRANLVIVPHLQARGRASGIRSGRRQGSEKAAGSRLCSDAYEALQGADSVVILTEWNEFRALDFDKVKAALKRPLMVDLRNIYRPSQMADEGFEYISVGRPPAGK
jgi:UDPglucose 6-dehydrogenase